MKFKFLPILLATFALGACGNGGASTTEPTSEPTSQPAPTWKYLDFVGDKQVRFDIIEVSADIQITYGNQVLAQAVNLGTLNDQSQLSVNKNLTADDSFNAIIVKEKVGTQHTADYLGGIEGDHLVEFFTETLNNVLAGVDRAYVAFSMGPKGKWTHNLNADLDAYLEIITNAGTNK